MLERLVQLTGELAAAKAAAEELYNQRREIWLALWEAGFSKAKIAKASGTTDVNVALGIDVQRKRNK